MEHVTAPDGTPIANERGGEGPPLVLVHGTTSDHNSWERVVADLRERFTVYAIDRRGRGESGDAEAYALAREFEDVAAVVDSIDEPVNLVGHSYGALCSLGAARLTDNLRRLVLYEPPLWTPDRELESPGDVVDRLYEHLEAAENEAILETFFRDVTDSADRLEIYRSQPSWPMRVEAAPTVPREIESLGEFRPEPGDLDDVTVPTLVLLGSETRHGLANSTRAAHALLPDSELLVLEGEGHAAMYTAPERLVEVLVEFLDHGG